MEVLDDGATQAKVQTMDQPHEFLVHLEPKAACSCFKLQDMIWPCQHVMAWDDQDSKDYGRHFHQCWRWVSVRKLYEPLAPFFLSNDLQPQGMCFLCKKKEAQSGAHAKWLAVQYSFLANQR